MRKAGEIVGMYEKLLQQCFAEGWSRFVLINHATLPYSDGVYLAQADSGFGWGVETDTFATLSAPIFSGTTSSWSLASNTFRRPARRTSRGR